MLLFLYFLLVECSCHGLPGSPEKKTVLQNTVATLPCPHRTGDVSWSRFRGGEMVILVTIKNGVERVYDKHYGSLSDNSLVIPNVTPSDASTYFCNRSRIYLEVTTDPNKVDPRAGNVPVTPRNSGHWFSVVSGQEGQAAADDEDAQTQQASDLWRIPVGVVVGASLMLLLVLILRFCSKKRKVTNTNVDKTVTEVIYEEIEAAEEQLRRRSDVESPYACTSIGDAQGTCTPLRNNLYSTVNKLKPAARSREECVYYLAQNPTQDMSADNVPVI